MTAVLMDFLLPRSAHTDMWRTAVPEDRVMRRALMAVVFLAVAGASGCITPDDKRQWQEALKDLRGENMEMKTMPSKKPPDPLRHYIVRPPSTTRTCPVVSVVPVAR